MGEQGYVLELPVIEAKSVSRVTWRGVPRNSKESQLMIKQA